MRKRHREINIFSISALDLFASALGAFILMSLIFMVFFTMTAREASEERVEQSVFAQCEADRGAALDQLAGAQDSLLQCRNQLVGAADATVLTQCEADRGLAQQELAQCRVAMTDTVDAAALSQCQASLAASQQSARDLGEQLAATGAISAELQEANAELQSCREMARRSFLLVIMSWSTRDDVDLHVVDPAGREFYFADRRMAGSAAAFEEDNINGPGNEVWLHPAAEPGTYRVCYKLYTRRGLSRPEVRGSVLWQEGSLDVPAINLRRDDEVRLAINIVVDDEGNVSLDRGQAGQDLGSGRCT